MNKHYLIILIFCFYNAYTFAGNPDRQGEAGAYELLMNPWARSAGLHSMNTSLIKGVESMRLNVAGLSRINKTEIVIGNTRYFEGTGIKLNSFGFVQKIGKNGSIGISVMAVDFGEIPVTTTDAPDGTGATFSPNFFHLGIGYAHTFENKISVGILLRAISESTADLSAGGFAIDAGVQYVTGEEDNFKFGISLRNIGSPMQYKGEGLTEQLPNPSDEISYPLTYFVRATKFELPSVLNIGGSYDFILNPKNKLTILGNFTSNSFSQDQIGAGIVYSFNDMFMLRAAYKYEIASGANSGEQAPIYTGISGGLSFEVPLKKETKRKFGIDYSYRQTKIWNGTHNISIRLSL
ncbi:MAG TPA: PorV/PorQ family protein [Saprospiraceae bacterium]|nr:PorV/PorQ family protein [Saprospiraceae bacterium]